MADKLRKYKSLYSSTCNTFSTGEGVTITPASVTGLPTDTEITLTFDRVDSSGTKTPSKMERIRGTITGGNFVISSGGRAVEGTEQVHTSPVVEMIWNADDWNDTVDWGLVEHSQLGVHDKTKVVDLTTAQTLTNKTLTSPLFNGNVDGWISANETWTYASATTITVPSGAAAKYAKGDKIRLKQGAGYKYFYVIGIADTVLTVTGGSDYTVATPTAITDNYYSHQTSPIGFPQWFSYTPTLTAEITNPTIGSSTISGKFTINGRTVIYKFNLLINTGGGWNAGNGVWGFSIPITAATNFNNYGIGTAFDSGTESFTARIEILSAESKCYMSIAKTSLSVTNSLPMTPATGDYYSGTVTYEI